MYIPCKLVIPQFLFVILTSHGDCNLEVLVVISSDKLVVTKCSIHKKRTKRCLVYSISWLVNEKRV
jgi:hypothetical protein